VTGRFGGLRYGIRSLAHSPGFTAVALLSLALGIGVNAAVLTVGRAVLLDPLPVDHPDRLMIAWWSRADTERGVMQLNSTNTRDEKTGRSLSSNFSFPAYAALRNAASGSADVFAFTFLRQANISVEGHAVAAGGMLASASYFPAIGVRMHVGRGFDERDDQFGAEPVAVLSYAFWQRTFGGDYSAIGKVVRINAQPFTVIGVTAPRFFGVSNGGFFPPTDITVPLSAQPLVNPRWTADYGSLVSAHEPLWLRVMMRLRPGAEVQSLQRTLTRTLAQGLRASGVTALQEAQSPELSLLPGGRGLDSMRGSLEKPIYVLAGVAALVLLIACVNVANLVVARGLARQQEFWIRLALGAGRSRLVRQTIVESLILAAAGGTLGLVLAVWTSPLLISTLAGSTPTALDVALDLRLLTAGLVSALTVVLFGIIPSLRLPASTFIRESGAGASRQRAGRVLVLVQIAVSVPLLVGAALFLRTLHNLSGVELGFNPRDITVFRLDPSLNGYDEIRVKRLYERVLDRLHSVPGVQFATLLENSLVSGWSSNSGLFVDSQPAKSMPVNRVGPAFFETMGIPVLFGRGIGLQDHENGSRVVVVNQAAARRLFGTATPIGHRIRLTFRNNDQDMTIVGVVGDSKYDSLRRAAAPIAFVPYFQSRGLTSMVFAIRSSGVPDVPEQIRTAVREVDADVPVTGLKTQSQQIAETIGSERAFSTLLVFFGAFALLLACIGLHGITAYAVARRTSEIGIRLALGAQRTHVIWLILRQVVVLAAGGLAIGVPAAAFASRRVRSFLFGVQATDAMSLALGAGVLFAVAVAASLLPARRAATLDPLTALRHE
jgi:predicted permease